MLSRLPHSTQLPSYAIKFLCDCRVLRVYHHAAITMLLSSVNDVDSGPVNQLPRMHYIPVQGHRIDRRPVQPRGPDARPTRVFQNVQACRRQQVAAASPRDWASSPSLCVLPRQARGPITAPGWRHHTFPLPPAAGNSSLPAFDGPSSRNLSSATRYTNDT